MVVCTAYWIFKKQPHFGIKFWTTRYNWNFSLAVANWADLFNYWKSSGFPLKYTFNFNLNQIYFYSAETDFEILDNIPVFKNCRKFTNNWWPLVLNYHNPEKFTPNHSSQLIASSSLITATPHSTNKDLMSVLVL